MHRADALALMHEYTSKEGLRKHMLAVEAAMRADAPRFGGEVEKWGVVGLLHDFGDERWPDPPKGIRTPIAAEVHAVLFEGKNPKQAVQDLTTRDLGDEEEE